MNNNKWLPEILYEENAEGITSGFPFINVPEDKNMPSCLFICEAREVSEDNSEIEKEISFHSYANMTLLKQELDVDTFDRIRLALGLKPLKEAISKGEKITADVKKSISQ